MSEKKLALLVEDSPDIALLVSRTLNANGYDVITEDTAAAARKKLGEGVRPDMLITDNGLIDGVLGTEIIADARNRNPNQPVVFLTGDPDAAEALEKKGIEVNTVKILKKPCASADILAAIAEAQIKAPGSHVSDIVSQRADKGQGGREGAL